MSNLDKALDTKAQNKGAQLGKSTVHLTISKLITMLLTMLTSMLLSRFRTLEEYGTYSQLLLVVSLFTSLFMLGLPNSINYFLSFAENKEEEKKFLSVYYTLSTILSMIMGGVLVLSVPLLVKYFNNPALNGFIYFLALYPWANVISSGVENILVVYKKTNFLLFFKLINSVFLLLIVLLVQWFNWTFEVYMVLYLGVFGAFAIAVYIISAKLGGGLRISFDKALIKKIFAFSVPIGLAGVVGTLNIELDKLMIGNLMTTAELAIYTNAAKELPITVIATSVTAVLLPQLTRMIKKNDDEGAIKLWGIATEISFIVTAIIVAGVFVYAEDVISILYSEKYLPGTGVFRVYTLILLLRCTYFGMILNAKGRTKVILVSSILSLVINAILNPLFYFAFGMIGPAIASLVAILLIQVLQLVFTSKATNVKFIKIFPWFRLLVNLAINVVFAVAFFFIKKWLPMEQLFGSIVESIVLGAVWVVIYLLVLKNRIKYLWQKLK